MNKQDWGNVLIVPATIAAVGLTFKIGYDYMAHKIENQNREQTVVSETEIPNPVSTYEIEIPNSLMPFEIEIPNPVLESEIEIQPQTTTFNSGIQLSDYDRWFVEAIVAGEAGWEPIEGKMGVAQCLRTAMEKDQISIQEVRTKYGYQGWHENFGLTNAEEYEGVREAVSRVFDNGEKITDENILWFYNRNKGYSGFHEGQKFVIEIGGHAFFAPWN